MSTATSGIGTLRGYHRVRGVLRRSNRLRAVALAARHRGLRREDVFIASYPRSGSTWMRFLLADLTTGQQPNFQRVDQLIPQVGAHADAPALFSGHRLLKTHEAYRQEYGRAVYLIRDMRDVLISWYRVTRQDPDDLSDLDAFVNTFVTERASPYGCWSDHVRGWLVARDRGTEILVHRFEDLKNDPVASLSRIASFVGLDVSQERISETVARNSADHMRELERADVGYLRRAFGYRSSGMRGVDGTWLQLLGERHMNVLKPLLVLNDELGYAR